jgi:hypothetical protein
MLSNPGFPAWWNWERSFTPHAELRMEQRGVTEVDVRAMLEGSTGFDWPRRFAPQPRSAALRALTAPARSARIEVCGWPLGS